MKTFEIINHYGEIVEYIHADDERQALCMYLMKHEELNDMMLWKSAYLSNKWKLAEYDNEEEYLMARKTYDF